MGKYIPYRKAGLPEPSYTSGYAFQYPEGTDNQEIAGECSYLFCHGDNLIVVERVKDSAQDDYFIEIIEVNR